MAITDLLEFKTYFLANCMEYKMIATLKNSAFMLISTLALVSCGITPPPLPTGGYIAYIKKDTSGKGELYRQDMIGMTTDGTPHKLSGVNGLLTNDIRYVNMTPDGKFLYFTERDSDINATSNDTIKVSNASGEVIWASYDTGCESLNYPELLSYRYDDSLDEVSFQLFAYCDGTGGIGITASKINDNPVNFLVPPHHKWLSSDPNIQNGYEYLSPPVGGAEWAAIPQEFSANPSLMSTLKVPYIYTSENLNFDFTHNNASIGNIPTAKCNGANMSSIVVKDEFKEDAGNPTNGISPLFAYPIKKAFAPSISAGGEYVMFNSEVYDTNSNRNEELFAVTLPQDWCQGYEIVSPPPPSSGQAVPLPSIPFHSDLMVLNSSSGNEYGSFAANTGTAYIMHRHNDPNNGGKTSLYIADKIDGLAVRLHPNATQDEQEGAWFFQ